MKKYGRMMTCLISSVLSMGTFSISKNFQSFGSSNKEAKQKEINIQDKSNLLGKMKGDKKKDKSQKSEMAILAKQQKEQAKKLQEQAKAEKKAAEMMEKIRKAEEKQLIKRKKYESQLIEFNNLGEMIPTKGSGAKTQSFHINSESVFITDYKIDSNKSVVFTFITLDSKQGKEIANLFDLAKKNSLDSFVYNGGPVPIQVSMSRKIDKLSTAIKSDNLLEAKNNKRYIYEMKLSFKSELDTKDNVHRLMRALLKQRLFSPGAVLRARNEKINPSLLEKTLLVDNIEQCLSLASLGRGFNMILYTADDLMPASVNIPAGNMELRNLHPCEFLKKNKKKPCDGQNHTCGAEVAGCIIDYDSIIGFDIETQKQLQFNPVNSKNQPKTQLFSNHITLFTNHPQRKDRFVICDLENDVITKGKKLIITSKPGQKDKLDAVEFFSKFSTCLQDKDYINQHDYQAVSDKIKKQMNEQKTNIIIHDSSEPISGSVLGSLAVLGGVSAFSGTQAVLNDETDEFDEQSNNAIKQQ